MTKLLLAILAPIVKHPLFAPIALPLCGVSWGIREGLKGTTVPGTWQDVTLQAATYTFDFCVLLGVASSGIVPNPTTPNLPTPLPFKE